VLSIVVFTGAIVYANDLVLLAPSQHAMRHMLRVCEAYSGDYDNVIQCQ